MNPVIYWIRHDFRCVDNPALHWAAARGGVIPVYILDNSASPPYGGASQWWLHHSLQELSEKYKTLGCPLILRRGNPLSILSELVKATGATSVCWNRCYEPTSITRDKTIKQRLQDQGIIVESHNASLLFEPWTIATGAKTPFKVYTPFSKACFTHDIPSCLPEITALQNTGRNLVSDQLEGWKLTPQHPDWSQGIATAWKVGRKAALAALDNFIDSKIVDYKTNRDRPDKEATSRLSPYLRWGQISAREIWHRIQHHRMHYPESSIGAECALKELLWREFSYHLLYHFPQLPTHPFNQKFADFPWSHDPEMLKLWQKGKTGYPIIDAGMRQLWETGWMHNRVRMIVASFLVKDLLIPWQEGAAWFWNTLVDADLASNSASWQWVAGCGADAAPYFRIFNPVLQGIKFDPDGDYVRRFVPELSKLPSKYIHEPCKADAHILQQAGVELGRNYPHPIVDHGQARNAALAAYKNLSVK